MQREGSDNAAGSHRDQQDNRQLAPARRSRTTGVLAVLVVISVAAIVAFGVHGVVTSDSKGAQTQRAPFDSAQVSDRTASAFSGQVTISAIGDCTLGTDENFDQSVSLPAVYDDEGDPSYFFANVASVLSADQLTIANFEGTISDHGERAEKTFAFRGDPEYAKILTSGSVEAANLANNHSMDYGPQAFKDTVRYLERAGIKTFIGDDVDTFETGGVKVGLYGVDPLDEGYESGRATMRRDVKRLKRDGCDLIVGVFHWGIEREYVPEDGQVSLAHAAIDAGTDLVLGGHPHVLQGIERYQGRCIVYSLGNFCFGGNSNPSDKDTMVFQQTFTLENGKLKIGKGSRPDASVVPCRLSSTPSYNDYQPTPLTGDNATGLIRRLNSYSEDLEGDAVLFSTTLNAAGAADVARID